VRRRFYPTRSISRKYRSKRLRAPSTSPLRGCCWRPVPAPGWSRDSERPTGGCSSFGLAYAGAPSREQDRDGDGYLDDRDGCPELPEDLDDFSDIDGCPDPDNDGDEFDDPDDECPNEPEDPDGWEDGDGCPDLDNDADGIVDEADDCRDVAEVRNGFEDEDGYPDDTPLVEMTCERLELRDRIYFDTDSDVIQTRSYALLDQAAGLLVARPEIRRVRIEGHTDDRGSSRHNQDLSQRRAESVRRYIIEQGVAAERLLAEGFGEDRAIAHNDSEEGRATNRRVDLGGRCRVVYIQFAISS